MIATSSDSTQELHCSVILSIYGQTLLILSPDHDHVFADSVSIRQLESFLLVTGKLLNRYSFQFSGSIVKNPFWDKSLTLRFSKEDKRRHKLRNKTNKQTTNHFKSMFRLISLRKCCGWNRYLPFYKYISTFYTFYNTYYPLSVCSWHGRRPVLCTSVDTSYKSQFHRNGCQAQPTWLNIPKFSSILFAFCIYWLTF